MPVKISVLATHIIVMVFLTVMTILMRKTVQPGLLVCAMQMNFSVKKMVSAFRGAGSVMVTQTASLVLMSTMAVAPGPAFHLISSVTMETAFTEGGSVMGTMTAWI